MFAKSNKSLLSRISALFLANQFKLRLGCPITFLGFSEAALRAGLQAHRIGLTSQTLQELFWSDSRLLQHTSEGPNF